ncbi:MAG: ferritin [Candidatus Aureabacteria bacterium]|nr:ferritin [Candidatus Auribacterota bacterium]
MDKKLVKAINEQITKEMYSSYLYLSMAAYFESIGLEGFSYWMKLQAQEEIIHGMKFFDYLNERGEKVILGAIDKPPVNFKSVVDVFKKTLEHEQLVTASINNLYSIANKVNDNASTIFLQWFINEQVEEEKNAMDILGKLKYVKAETAGMLMLDKELAARPQPILDPKAQ